MRYLPFAIILCFYTVVVCCSGSTGKPEVFSETTFDSTSADDFFNPLLADGFSYPFGDGNGGGSYVCIKDKTKHEGWYIATQTGEKYSLGIHTGEDWNGKGGGETDFGQPVYATAKGKVIAAKDYGAPWGNVVYVEHCFIENAKKVTVYSLYAHLNEIVVKPGDVLNRRQKLGTIGNGHNSYPAHLHFEIRNSLMKDYDVTYWPSSNKKDQKWVLEHYLIPSDFIEAHKKIKLPATYDTLIVAEKSKYKMHVYAKGKKIKTYDIALSQSPIGHKQKEGDLKLPEGEYFITEKNTGPFSGDYKEFFGPAWFRLSYPNKYDAEAALKRGAINKATRNNIVSACKKEMQPPANTGLGGGIGIHGWAGDWPEGKRHLTWGCISMKNSDLKKFYSLIPVKTRIFILP